MHWLLMTNFMYGNLIQKRIYSHPTKHKSNQRRPIHHFHAEDDPEHTDNIPPQVKELIEALQGEMGREQLQSALGLSDQKSFHERYLKPALENGLIQQTIPDKPNSRLQKYRLTNQGRLLKDKK